jgi:hypothetical protein
MISTCCYAGVLAWSENQSNSVAKMRLSVVLSLQFFAVNIFGCAAFCLACVGQSNVKPDLQSTANALRHNKGLSLPSNTKHYEEVSIHSSLHKTITPLSKPGNLLSKLTFSWTSDILKKGNIKPLELSDLWRLPRATLMDNSSMRFNELFEQERHRNVTINTSKSILHQYYASPITRAILAM